MTTPNQALRKPDGSPAPTSAAEIPTINDLWRRYFNTVYPNGATNDQAIQLKRAFFMGACTMFEILTEHVAFLPDDPRSEEAAMQSLRKQILGFNEAVKLGEA